MSVGRGSAKMVKKGAPETPCPPRPRNGTFKAGVAGRFVPSIGLRTSSVDPFTRPVRHFLREIPPRRCYFFAMSHAERFGELVTKAYINQIKNEVLLKYPNFFFEKGSIVYDYDRELYMYKGYSDEELFILAEAASKLKAN
jgi:hypothetical protein